MLAPNGKRWKLIVLFGLAASLTNFLLGFSNAYPNTSGDSFQEFVNASYIEKGNLLTKWEFTWFWTTFLNIWAIGYLFGNLLTPFLCDHFGRKYSLIAANTLNFISSIVFTATIYFEMPLMLFVGRVICSIASSVSFAVLIVFLQEVAPTNLRGFASSFSELVYLFTACIGLLLGMNAVLGRKLLFLVGFGMIPSFFSILFVAMLPESPKFLLIHKKNREQAIKSLHFYQGNTGNRNMDLILNQMMKESTESYDKNPRKLLHMIFRRIELRKAVFVGIAAIQLAVPIWPLTYLTTELLEAHFLPDLAQAISFAFMIINFVACLIGIFFIERYNRRLLLIGSGVLNTLSLALYVLFDRLAFYVHVNFRYGCIFALIFYAITYGGALGPMAFSLNSELVSQQFRCSIQAIVFAVNTVISFLVSFFLLPLYRIIDIWAFIPLLIVPASIALVYLYLEMPETRGKEIYEVVLALQHKPQAVSSTKKTMETSFNGKNDFEAMTEIDLKD